MKRNNKIAIVITSVVAALFVSCLCFVATTNVYNQSNDSVDGVLENANDSVIAVAPENVASTNVADAQDITSPQANAAYIERRIDTIVKEGNSKAVVKKQQAQVNTDKTTDTDQAVPVFNSLNTDVANGDLSYNIVYDKAANKNILHISDSSEAGYTQFDSETEVPWFENRFIINKVVIDTAISPKSLAAWFGCIKKEESGQIKASNVESINGFENIDFSKAKDTSFMFAGCNKLELSGNFPSLTAVEKVEGMFAYTPQFSDATLQSALSTMTNTNIKDFSLLFNNTGITKADLSSLNIAGASKLKAMFLFNTPNATSALTFVSGLPATTTATDTSGMFYGCSKITEISAADNTNWSTLSTLINSDKMFEGCKNLPGYSSADKDKLDKTYAYIYNDSTKLGFFAAKASANLKLDVDHAKFDTAGSGATKTIHLTTDSDGEISFDKGQWGDYYDLSYNSSNKQLTITAKKYSETAIKLTINQAPTKSFKADSVVFTIDSIDKVAPVVTAPVGLDNLVYDGGNDITLVSSSGSAVGGTMQYVVNLTEDEPSTDWKDSIDTVTNAGTYYVHYYAKSNNEDVYKDSDKNHIKVVVDKAANPIKYDGNLELNSFFGNATSRSIAASDAKGNVTYTIESQSGHFTLDSENESLTVDNSAQDYFTEDAQTKLSYVMPLKAVAAGNDNYYPGEASTNVNWEIKSLRKYKADKLKEIAVNLQQYKTESPYYNEIEYYIEHGITADGSDNATSQIEPFHWAIDTNNKVVWEDGFGANGTHILESRIVGINQDHVLANVESEAAGLTFMATHSLDTQRPVFQNNATGGWFDQSNKLRQWLNNSQSYPGVTTYIPSEIFNNAKAVCKISGMNIGSTAISTKELNKIWAASVLELTGYQGSYTTNWYPYGKEGFGQYEALKGYKFDDKATYSIMKNIDAMQSGTHFPNNKYVWYRSLAQEGLNIPSDKKACIQCLASDGRANEWMKVSNGGETNRSACVCPCFCF